MTSSNIPRKWCQRIFNKMLGMNITKLISQEMSNRQSTFTLSFDKINDKLSNNMYQSTKEWINDVNSVLLNEQRFYEKNSQFSNVVQYLQKWFDKKVKIIPYTEMDAWMVDYHHTQERLKKLAELNPPS